MRKPAKLLKFRQQQNIAHKAATSFIAGFGGTLAARKKGYEIKDVRQQALIHLWEQIQLGKTTHVAAIASRLAKTPRYRNKQEAPLNPNIKVQAVQERDYPALAEEAFQIFKLRHPNPKQRSVAKRILEGYGTVEITKGARKKIRR